MIVRNPRFTVIGVLIIIGLGLPPLIYGMILMFNSDPPALSFDDLKTLNLIQPKTATLTPTYDSEKNALVDQILITFDTTVIFEDDWIGVNATAIGVDPSVLGIVLFVTSPMHDIKSLSGNNLAREINHGIKNNITLQLYSTVEPKFKTREMIPFYQAGQEVTIKGVIILKNTTRGDEKLNYQDRNIPKYVELNSPVFTVLPKTEKLQAITNNAVILLVNQTRVSNWGQDKANNLILGLTWIGIGIIPFLVGTDMLLRIYLTEKDAHVNEVNLTRKRISYFFSNIRSKLHG